MKFNLKALAAAAMLVATGSSFAQVALNNTTNPDVYFAAYDQGAGIGFALDTNIGWTSLTTPFATFTYDLDNSSAWNSFKAASAANAASTGIQWGTYSGRSGSAAPAGFLVGNNSEVASPTILATAAAGIRSIINTNATTANTVGNSDNGVYITSAVSTTFGPSMGLAGDFALRTSWDTTEAYAIGASQNLFKYTIAAAQTNQWVGTSSIGDGNVLTVAAVPEPGTYALMLAGLLTLGAVARRRSRR